MVLLLRKIVGWMVLNKTQLTLHDSAIMLLGIYPKELRRFIHQNTYTEVMIAALFNIAKSWKQLNVLQVSGCDTSRRWDVT